MAISTRFGVGALLLFTFLAPLSVAAADPPSTPPASVSSLAGFFGGGTLDLNLRGYFMNRTFGETPFEPETVNEAFVLGGGLVYRTGQWHGASLGFSVYTSQKVYAPPEKGGTSLLKGGESYSALAETYLQWDGGKTTVRLFRQRIDTPILGSRDFRMVPFAWEAYTVENRSVAGLTAQLSYITKVKDWTSSVFVPLGEWLELPEGTAATGLLGLVYDTPGKRLHTEGWLYLTKDVATQVYVQADGLFPLGRDLALTVSGQGIYQHDLGKALYNEFQSGILGGKLALGWKGIEVRVAGNVSSRDGAYLNLFGLYPGFTSIMEEDNNIAGEKSWLVGATIDFAAWGLPGLTFNWDHTKAWVPDPPLGMGALDQSEHDFELNYRFQGSLKGLRLRARHAQVDSALDQGTIFGRDMSDYRFNVEYVLPLATVLRN